MPLPDNLPSQNPYGPAVTFQTSGILPPSALYIGPNDAILVNVISPSVAATLTIWTQFLRADGVLISSTYSAKAVQGNNGQVLTIAPAEGFLLSFVVQSSIVSRGQVFVRVFTVPGGERGLVGSLPRVFLQGYASAVDLLNYPGSIAESSLSGRGWLHVIHLADVTGGTPAFVVPANTHWLFRCVQGQFTASAAGVARSLSLTVNDGLGNQICQIGASATVAPSISNLLAWAPGLTLASAGIFQTMGFPRELVLTPGMVVALNTVVLDVGDKWQLLNLAVEEFVGQ